MLCDFDTDSFGKSSKLNCVYSTVPGYIGQYEIILIVHHLFIRARRIYFIFYILKNLGSFVVQIGFNLTTDVFEIFNNIIRIFQ